jgi:uncharacterized protein involved in type VI secretion and phage assembly
MPASAMQTPERQHARFFGKYRGVVLDNVDPQGRGRLQVRVPQVLDTVKVWAMPCVPYAGKNKGFFAMPDKNTGVWIEFEAGDPSFPIWVGCFWGKTDIPKADSKPDIKFFKTKKFSLRIDDGVGEIKIENDSGSQIVIKSTEILTKSNAVKAEAAGGKKSELTNVSFKVNDGALEVL